MKDDPFYAENTVNYDDAQFELIGCNEHEAKTLLETLRNGESWLFLDRKEPVDDGAVATDKIRNRLRSDGL